MIDKLVETRNEIVNNILNLYNYIKNDNDQIAKDLLTNGKWFVGEEINGELFFAPSKFVGYKNNDLYQHNKIKTQRDGRITDKHFKKNFYNEIRKSQNNDYQNLINEFNKYLRRLGIQPNTKPTGFFVSPNLRFLSAKAPISISKRSINSISDLKQDDVIDNTKLTELFKCSGQGGMRKSNTTNTLVLITNYVKSTYLDKWDGDTLHYTGMGQVDDQSLNNRQNRTLKEIDTNHIEVHYFNILREKEYTYVGQLIKDQDPYEAFQPDSNGNMRKVWIFRLKLKNILLPSYIFQKSKDIAQKEAEEQDDATLFANYRKQNKTPEKRKIISPQYIRNSYLVELVKRKADGVCDLCKNDAPFIDNKSRPFLECHHIVWLSKGGNDTLENAVALCPNCHRKMHHVKDKDDIDKLKKIALLRSKDIENENKKK